MNRTGLKYYLRALGIGIIVTALLMGYSQKGQAQMTDEEILQRAAQLGMTESQAEFATAPPETNSTLQSLAESMASPTPAPEETAVNPTPSPAEEPTESPEPTPAPTEEPATSPEPTPAPTEEPAASSTPTLTEEPVASPAPDSTEASVEINTSDLAGEVVTLVINRGESSMTVSKSLEELGLVEDSRTYDRYLCDNGYDHSICAGTHEIPMGATEEEIARIICKLK